MKARSLVYRDPTCAQLHTLTHIYLAGRRRADRRPRATPSGQDSSMDSLTAGIQTYYVRTTPSENRLL
jgi:hypothetical protein